MVTFEKDVIDRLGRIETKLDHDYHTLHGGDGQPGLIQKQDALSCRVQTLEENKNHGIATLGLVGWIITTLIALYGAVRHIN